jgi:fluoride exporter
MIWLWVAAGSAIGGVLRYGTSAAVSAALGARFPWGTFAVNALGSLAIGILAVWISTRSPAWPAREFLLIGVLGGFTTFSSFSLEVLQLLQAGDYKSAAGYIGASLIVCVGAAAIGAWGMIRAL